MDWWFTPPRVTRTAGCEFSDFWHSREAYERFDKERLRPAIADAVGDDADHGIELQIHELHSLVRPVGVTGPK